MCGEVAVLTLIEFELTHYWHQKRDDLRELINERNAVPMLHGPLEGKTILQIAQRLDELLHKKTKPWVREHAPSLAFVNDYVPMLETDRKNIDHNWNLMKLNNWRPTTAPNSRYSQKLDGLELTQWMIEDFYHLIETDDIVDEPLREFNRQRRVGIILPNGWNGVINNE